MAGKEANRKGMDIALMLVREGTGFGVRQVKADTNLEERAMQKTASPWR